jgi:hypothetical protein
MPKNNPPVITILIGGMFTIPSHGWFMTWFYQHYHNFGHFQDLLKTQSDQIVLALAMAKAAKAPRRNFARAVGLSTRAGLVTK